MNQPDKSGVWEIARGDMVLVGIVDIDKEEIQLPTAEAPYRIGDLDDYEWKYLREKY